ncbi:FtsX-like permease family protein [Fulvivirga sp. RKSG066]|uniref:ABC transporter permease n=1 Tax=Fulvivirga aurantia TaxID=2529383 RepID=UPI0012BBBE97|nr:ABC transporter permease [Fulvivirga aurantia]MTI21382.1 FtsX-like permease family protein [Fulvivirga aurantia]
MIHNYLKIALRTIRRKTGYSIINVVGLASGLLCVVFILNWVIDELSYDKHIPNNNNIYRVVAEAGTGSDRWHQSVTSLPLGGAMVDMFPEVKTRVRLDKNNALVENGDLRFVEQYIILTDPEFFDVFGYHLLSGNEKTALSAPYQIVLTETMANKYFGKENPIGKTLKIFQYDPDGNGVDYEVTGVIADPPKTSHFTFNFLASISTIESVSPEAMEVWGNNSYHTYVVLQDGSSAKKLEAKLPKMVNEHLGETIAEYDLYFRFYLQPITDIYLHSDLQYEFLGNGSIEYVWIFSAVGIFILILACINYINLSTSFSLDRAKEIGVRKVLGAYKGQLIKQHLTETLVLTCIAMVCAGLLVELLKPFFFELTGKTHLEFDRITLSLQLLLICIPLGLISGYFPAYLLANVKTTNSLKGKIQASDKSQLRKALVTFQFAVTMVILVGLVVVKQQLNFVQTKDLGYDKSNLLVLRVNGNSDVINGYQPFINTLKSSTELIDAARSGSMITGGLGNSNMNYTLPNGDKHFLKMYRLPVDYDYIQTYKMTLLAGRNFDEAIASDTTQAFILNEAAVAAFGWSMEEALGKEVSYIGREGRIVGVVKNFHFNSLHHAIEPLCMFLNGSGFSRITLRGQNPQELLNTTTAAWKAHFPGAVFDFTFQDEALFSSYENDQRFGTIFNSFSILSILIAFLGLFGLIGYTVHRKTKEIGVRKVLGATSLQIVNMIAHNFLKLIIIASVIAIPFGWYLMNSWLKDFSYRIEISPWHFIVAAVTLIAAALLIICIQTIKPSMASPANTLKEE